jgi:hypothetical protein
MEITLVGLVLAIAVLLWLLLRAKKSEGRDIEKAEQMEAYIEKITKSAKEVKQNEKTVTNLSRDELRKRLQD